jgi:hypothetical protein
LISSGLLPDDPIHGIYGVIFHGSMNFYDDIGGNGNWAGGLDGGNWCGFHSQTSQSGKIYKFHVIGDSYTSHNYPIGCERDEFISAGESPNNNIQADNIVKAFTHSLIEIGQSDYCNIIIYENI